MSALDKLAQKGNFTAIESVIYTYAILEKDGRGDGLSIASEKAAEELSAMQARIEELLAGFKSIGIEPADEDLHEIGAGKWFYVTDSGEELVDTLDEAISKTMILVADQSQ